MHTASHPCLPMFGWRWFHSVSRRTTSITHWAHVQDCWLCNSRRLSVNSCVISKHSNWIYCRRTTYHAQQESVLWTHPKLASSGWQAGGEYNTGMICSRPILCSHGDLSSSPILGKSLFESGKQWRVLRCSRLQQGPNGSILLLQFCKGRYTEESLYSNAYF